MAAPLMWPINEARGAGYVYRLLSLTLYLRISAPFDNPAIDSTKAGIEP